LSVLQSVLTKTAGKYQIPIAFKTDEIKAGGLLNSTKMDCLVVHHPQHYSDYFRYAVSIKRQGIMAYISINSFGRSNQANLHNIAANRAELMQQGKVGMSLLAGVVGMGKNKNKLEDENNYYTALEQIFDEALEEGLEEEMLKAKRKKHPTEQNKNVAISKANKIAPNENNSMPKVNRATGLCPACGSTLKQNAKFCSKCGVKINQ
jgi:hypothetical protein